MKLKQIFPIDIFTFHYENLDEIPNLIYLIESNITHKVSVGMTASNLHKDPETNNLVNFFDSCLEEVRNYYNYDCEKISITTMWGNMTDSFSGDQHHQHKHPLSFISGVFYLSEGSNTVFFNPSNFEMFHVWKNLPDERDGYMYEHTPKVGELILFPSWLQHSTRPHRGNHHRHTISINTLPSGLVNSNSLDRATMWNIEVK